MRPYTLRISPRARRIRLSVTPEDGLVVVLPKGVARHHADRVVIERETWIAEALERVAGHASHLAETAALPDTIELLATAERIAVRYEDGRIGARLASGVLVVRGADDTERRRALLAWLQRAAADRLRILLAGLARETGLPYARLTVRSQRTRWGSMTRRGSVSLNRSLVFLPPHLARYVVLHELVHGLRFDHSPAFWAELIAREPEARRYASELREAWRFVPGWATPLR